MIMIPAAIIGAILGAFRARQRGGNALDMLQYAGAHAIAFFIIALIFSLLARWQGWL